MEPSPELRELMLRYYQASAESDADFLDDLIARVPEGLIIGTDDEEWWADGATAADVWTSAWRRRGSSAVINADPQGYAAGNIGWVVDHPSWQGRDGSARPFRLTAIFERIDGVWKLVHAHFSFGVPNGS